jgi:DoxX-like family
MRQPPGIYVEILIRGDIEQVWQRTQDPQLHELWDLRFTRIQYLPRTSPAEPQRFLYTTQIGFGLRIDGEGESTGTHEEETGVRTSALKFWSDDPKSLIREGSGYWKYIPTAGGVRFLTWYDYQTRFGAAGRLLDGFLFRPLLGWATAWSFDRLRLWIEDDIPPKTTLQFATIHACARLAIAFVWFWQGLVPKVLFNQLDDRIMMMAAHMPTGLLRVIGGIEIGFSVLTLLTWRWRTYFIWNIIAMVVALMTVAVPSPAYLAGAFNPMTLNAAVIALSIVGYIASAELPSASRCLRRPPRETA